ncbi:hypothetical protein A167_01905 [Alcanivorax sp. S71-1-4]|jgi:predicted nicotinamide N-methyase|uniref:class I SAM-dependent methyltransferase n=1 Tax=Alcanivorax sp. S71-1-4 TaxID=1177159 RepID=UPI00135A0D49|nr:50S ribosomal protein L11 methyltransferase [Alcanivorax sp. S71-1-4]KAF0809313.1 hypothetical protein A167_01905 [Alcanivorax sp. S71-1-4]
MTAESGKTAPSGLLARLQAVLPEASLAATPLPRIPTLRLWLLADILSSRALSPQTVNTLMEEPPYWSFCWASGQVLGAWLLAHPAAVAGRTVVDVGSGSGVVALSAALAGAARVIACDLDPYARLAVQENAVLNGLRVETCEDLAECLPRADVLTAADILYDRDNLTLLETFRAVPSVWLADSRIPDLNPPGYRRLAEDQACTWPDLGESSEYNRVRLFVAEPVSPA